MKNHYFQMLISIILLLLLVGCESNEEYISSMYSKEEGSLEVYIVYSDEEQLDNSSLMKETLNYLPNHLEKDAQVTTMYHDTERFVKIFNIKEFPTMLLFDHESVLLQTTDPDEFKEFITQYE